MRQAISVIYSRIACWIGFAVLPLAIGGACYFGSVALNNIITGPSTAANGNPLRGLSEWSNVKNTPDGSGVEFIQREREKSRLYIEEFHRRTGLNFQAPIPAGQQLLFDATVADMRWMESPEISPEEIVKRLESEHKNPP